MRPSPRELQILTLYAAGLTREEIGRELYLSPRTIATNLANATEKLEARNSVHAVTRCLACGYLCVDGVTGDVYATRPLDDALVE